MNLYDAILVRKSVKNYHMDELEQTMLNNILNFANHLSMLTEDNKVQYKILHHSYTDNKLLSIFSVKAPYYFVIASDNDDLSLMNNAYLMEQISLYLTTKGIGSYLIGKKKINKELVDGLNYDSGLIMAFGKAKDNIYRDVRKLKHIDEKDICIYKCEPDMSLKSLMKIASYSTANRTMQPFRFVIYDNRIHLFSKKETFHARTYHEAKNIDIGIILAHLLVAAEELWFQTTIKKQENITNREMKNNEYVISLFLKAA
ncbi:nitroreductase family protein [Anaeromicropila herbilytica]|uniref:Putative nitroreductase TM1586 domain-containing protein n=1 Tax=Anaeromicropila herbilytica TaxID=2785025 RepID=A0A7R7IBZ7_9FIRM|nr:nitroreductase family protein [Anaeromicropila herbilytica]BCN30183.1 hypothetical protein bsdtb5_14780 [Anaeromicropila herbilytica]